MTRVAFIGLGLIGRERALAIDALRQRGRSLTNAGVYDPDRVRSDEIHNLLGAPVLDSVQELIQVRPDWFIVATPHDTASALLPRLLATGANVLVEKPLGRTHNEAEVLTRLSAPGQLWVGFNYRFFAGVSTLIRDARRGTFGRPVAVNAIVGHGGAPGMENSWKLDPVRAGGGALIDPGIHLLDLALVLAGEPLKVVGGTAWNGFWNNGIEEECHLLLAGAHTPVVNLQTSIVRWRSIFRLELHGDEGYGIVEGRGRSYGAQSYRIGRRWGWQTAPSQRESEQLVLETSGDDVFERELEALLFGTRDAIVGPCDGDQALAAMLLLDECRTHLGM
jgi:predicted dehydrogenase